LGELWEKAGEQFSDLQRDWQVTVANRQVMVANSQVPPQPLARCHSSAGRGRERGERACGTGESPGDPSPLTTGGKLTRLGENELAANQNRLG